MKLFLKGSLVPKKLSYPVKEPHPSVIWVPGGRSKFQDTCARLFTQCTMQVNC